MKPTRTNLYTSSYGVQFNRIDYKERSQVRVQNPDHYTHMVYGCYNIPFFEHKYMSWENLNLCGGWGCDEEEVIERITDDKKVAGLYACYGKTRDSLGDIIIDIRERMGEMADSVVGALFNDPWETYTKKWGFCIGFARKGKLSDFYDFQQIREAYGRQGVNFTAKEVVSIMKKMDMEISDLMFTLPDGYDPVNPRGDDELVVTGMLFGYPIESTASLIMCYGW